MGIRGGQDEKLGVLEDLLYGIPEGFQTFHYENDRMKGDLS
jgi:hypothetical protein